MPVACTALFEMDSESGIKSDCQSFFENFTSKMVHNSYNAAYVYLFMYS